VLVRRFVAPAITSSALVVALLVLCVSPAAAGKRTTTTATTAAPVTTAAPTPTTAAPVTTVAPSTTVAPTPTPTTVAEPVTTTTVVQPTTTTVVEPTTTAVSPTTSTDVCTRPALRVVPVGTVTSLKTAIAGAQPGDRIVLADGTYTGSFFSTVSGTALSRIAVCGTRNAIVTAGSTTGAYVWSHKGSYWDFKGFTITNGQKGLVLDSANFNVIDSIDAGTFGDEAIHFRTNSTNNRIVNSVIHDTGKRDYRFGEGVYVGSAVSNWATYTSGLPDMSDLNVIEGNRFYNTTAEGVDVKEGTTGGTVANNTFDGTGMASPSWVDIKGNNWTIKGNSGRVTPRDGFLTEVAATGWGIGNVFSGNTADLAGASGYGFNVRAGNVVACSNVVLGSLRLANIICSV
jgi:hypothetical protein